MISNPKSDEAPAIIRSAMRARDVIDAYARWAPVYDIVFGPIMESSRKNAVAALPATARDILEVGVGTGISLGDYRKDTRVTGIDLSPDMLARARERVARDGLTQVDSLVEMDASQLAFGDSSFDSAMAMYVMTVVPDPVRVWSEMQRVVRPGGRLYVVSHFAAEKGIRRMIGRVTWPIGRLLGWNTTITAETLISLPGTRLIANRAAGLGGFYRLLEFEVVKS